MTIADFRRYVRTFYPHVRVSIRTVSFVDLARTSAKVLTITGDRDSSETSVINKWAKEAGVIPDGNIRYYGKEAHE